MFFVWLTATQFLGHENSVELNWFRFVKLGSRKQVNWRKDYSLEFFPQTIPKTFATRDKWYCSFLHQYLQKISDVLQIPLSHAPLIRNLQNSSDDKNFVIPIESIVKSTVPVKLAVITCRSRTKSLVNFRKRHWT